MARCNKVLAALALAVALMAGARLSIYAASRLIGMGPAVGVESMR